MATHNFLQGQAITEFNAALNTLMGTEPADRAAVLAGVDAYLESQAFKAACVTQVLKYNETQGRPTSGGQLVAGLTINDGGTGYAVGDMLPVTGATSGTGGVVRVSSVAAGVIDGVELWSVGDNYVGVLTVDATGAGNGDADVSLDNAATYEDATLLADLATIAANVGTAEAVAVNAGGTGYTEDDVLTLANGIVITVGVTTGAVSSVKSIDTNVTGLTANATAVACTGGTGGDDATFDVTAYLL